MVVVGRHSLGGSRGQRRRAGTPRAPRSTGSRRDGNNRHPTNPAGAPSAYPRSGGCAGSDSNGHTSGRAARTA